MLSRTSGAKGGRDLVGKTLILVCVHPCENGACGEDGKEQVLDKRNDLEGGDFVAGSTRMDTL